MPTEQLLQSTEAQKAAEKQEVKGYFETTGFDRWNRIYSESDDVNKVQRNIRIGHQKTVDNVLAWLQEQGQDDLSSSLTSQFGSDIPLCYRWGTLCVRGVWTWPGYRSRGRTTSPPPLHHNLGLIYHCAIGGAPCV